MAQTYDFKKVTTVVAGQIITGYMDGSVVRAEKNEDNRTPHVGAAGDVTMVESNNDTGTITITIKPTSPSLANLVRLAKAKESFSVQVIDNNSNKIKAGGNEAYILRTPGAEWGNELTGVEIPIFVADYDFSV